MDQTNQSEDEKLIDLTQLKLISRGNKQFIQKMLLLFTSMGPKCMINFNNYLAEANWQKIGDLAHSLKPTIDTLGIITLQSPIRKLEKIAKTDENKKEIKDLTNVVILHLQIALDEAKIVLQKMK